MTEERRKLLRYECCVPAEIIKLEGEYNLTQRATVRDLTSNGLKLVINFNINSNINQGSSLKLRLYCPEIELSTSLLGEIKWSKCAENKLELGLKIKEMDKNLKRELLNWIFPRWIERKTGKKRQANISLKK
jgi:hypothetical protein